MSALRNIKLTIEYDGTNYCGWQTQKSRSPCVTPHRLKTIQQTIEDALAKILRKRVSLIGSGRTDSGVHAASQVANFKTDNPVPLDKLKAALNGILPFDIAVKGCEEVPLDFHSRFDVTSKTYAYHILQAPTKAAFARSHIWAVRHPLDLNLMRREARSLLGTHDFKSFQAHDRVERSSRSTIRRITIKQHKSGAVPSFFTGSHLLTIEIEASGFMRNMVRNIVGTLVEVGKGRIKKGELERILKKKDRRLAGPCAPAKGLYLLWVSYD